MSVASGELRASHAVSRRRGYAIALRVAPVAAVGAAAIWPEWARFRMATPSFVDDWLGVTYGKEAFHALLHGTYSSSGVDFAGRYRPAYTAIWNYAQWHLLGSPSTGTAAAWAVLRACLFLSAVWLLAAWVLEDRSVGRRAVWLVPFAVALTPGVAASLERFGPGDPLMLAGLVLGLALIARGVRTFLFDRSASHHRARAAALIALGYAVYLFGAYTKESSFCVLAFLPFFLKWLGPSTRRYVPQSRQGRSLLAVLGALILAPLVHQVAHLGLAFMAGDRPYPVEHTVTDALREALVSPLIGAPGLLRTWLWTLAVPIAVSVVIEAARRRHRDAWLLSGILLTGFLMSALSLARGEIASWYYVPWVVAVAVVSFRGIARAPVVQLAVCAFVTVVGLTSTRAVLADWTRTERGGSTAIAMAKGAIAANCQLYLANFDIERRFSIPLLFPFAKAERLPDCAGDSRIAYALTWEKYSLPTEFKRHCSEGWEKILVRESATMYRCGSFRATRIPDQLVASSKPDVKVVRVRALARPPTPSTIFQPVAKL